MSTTTIRIEDDLKARLAAAAERAGVTAHAFMVEAIERGIEQSELDAEFQRVADERWARLAEGGGSVSWPAARRYLEAKARGECPRRPSSRRR